MTTDKKPENVEFEKLKIEFETFRRDITTIFNKLFINSKGELYSYIAREIKNECDIQTLLDFLYDEGIIDQKEFSEHRKKSALFQGYKDENNNIYNMSKYIQDLETNFRPDLIENPSNFVSVANLLAQRQRFIYKKGKMLQRGFAEDSKEINEINQQIIELDNLLKKQKSYDTKRIKDEEYYLKIIDAEKIYGSIIKNKEEIINRIRKVPLIDSKFHLEAHNKSLYYEVVSNYWFGNFNASICMLSIFVESFLKELWYYKKKEHYEGEFENLIEDCLKLEILNELEKKFLQELREYVRNNYIHMSLHKIIKDAVVPAYEVSLDGKYKPKKTYLTAEKMPVLRSLLKTEVDKERSRELIIEVVKLVENVTTRNYDFQIKKEK